ncbi:MAG: hypothetical protein ACRYGK_17665 [Janthinobacterium lividum]
MASITLATEDELSEAIGTRLLAEIDLLPDQIQSLRKNGSGYLKLNIKSWKELARIRPVLLITDLDNVACPVTMREQLIGSGPIPKNLLIRIAVREVESWVLADHDAAENLFGRKIKLPPEPDTLPDPTSHLLRLAKSASRKVRDNLVKEANAVARQGLGYNAHLKAWILTHWNPERAASRSPSLARTRLRLQDLQGRM